MIKVINHGKLWVQCKHCGVTRTLIEFPCDLEDLMVSSTEVECCSCGSDDFTLFGLIQNTNEKGFS
ncbi:MAG: hypothetical protein OXJ64_17315 [Boseongicola sp.]|nr:hypothetical protein [Boseongicola sp.]